MAMYYSEYHNHKWARNLAHARRLLETGDQETFYRGEDLPEGDVYPGMRVMAAYWVSVEHEMKMRLGMLLKGGQHPGWRKDAELLEQRDLYANRFLADMRELVAREAIAPPGRITELLTAGLDTPDNWAAEMQASQQATERTLDANDPIPSALVEAWFNSCLRSVANYNTYLIWGAVIAAALIQRVGPEALTAAIDATSEEFMWEISREFYVNVMPSVGFEELGDVMELGMRGMFSDQYYESGEEREEGENTVKESVLRNCELAGIFHQVAEWSGLSKTALGYGICRYCELHGEATMLITMPPMYAPSYRRVQSLGMDDEICLFELVLTPADDMERLMSTHTRVFGEMEA